MHDLTQVDARDILVCDVIQIETGNLIHGDGVLVDGNLKCDQSELTGETEPAAKILADLYILVQEIDGTKAQRLYYGYVHYLRPWANFNMADTERH